MSVPSTLEPWTAQWIARISDPRDDVGVLAFRCPFQLDSPPTHLPIRISADQRYKLYVNGEMVAFGPQRGDLRHWFYETVDIAPFLKPGMNWVAAAVWNFGRWAPMAQHTFRTAFVVEAPERFKSLSTPGDWKVARLAGWDFAMMHTGSVDFYIDVGPGEIVDATSIPVGWEIGGQGLDWTDPHAVSHAEHRGMPGGGTSWMLVPRSIPSMRYDLRKAMPVLRSTKPGRPFSPGAKLKAGSPALFDYGELLCAYPRVRLKGEAGTTVTLTFAEALWNPDGSKGNRNEIDGKEMRGYEDRFVLNGKARTFEPLWWRTYRYVQISADRDATIETLDAVETGYPLAEESSFEADHPSVKPIWDVSVRTAARCAGEHYFDCPYYEQLQYAGDTRIQAMVGYYLGRDRALTRNAVETLGWSLMENELTQSRYPSRQTQVIPPFSLWWLLMLHDQAMYDDPTARPAMATPEALRGVLEAYRKLALAPEGDQFWQFGDWVPTWRWGVPPGSAGSPMHQLTYALARKATLELLGASAEFNSPAIRLDAAGLTISAGGGPDQEPTEHAEALRRLLDPSVGPWPAEALAKANAAKCTYYQEYYKHLAMRPDDYVAELEEWRDMIERGLSTFAENPEPTRSDCHAWSAHPIIGFFQLVAGVTSVAPGWTRARIAPKPGSLQRFDARIAHPAGELRVGFESGKLEVDSPVPAEVVWRGETHRIEPGPLRL